MSGTVAVVANDLARYTLFSVSLNQLKSPPNTRLDWGLSTDIAGARNSLVARALEEGSEWVFFVDDDHVFPADVLMRLLEHDLDMVCALYLRRNGGFHPVACSQRAENGLYDSIDLRELPGEGLLKIHATGGAGMLIKAEVFRAIDSEPTWFEHGRVGEWHAAEDIIFCEKVNAAGFDIFLDLEARLGHMTPSAIWPSWVDNEWAVGFSVADGTSLYVPIENAAEAADAVRR